MIPMKNTKEYSLRMEKCITDINKKIKSNMKSEKRDNIVRRVSEKYGLSANTVSNILYGRETFNREMKPIKE